MTRYNLDATNMLFRLRRERRISWRAVGLGLAIVNFINKEGGAWPSRATLSAITGIEESDISRVGRSLRDTGFLTIEERDGRSTIYRLTHGHLATGGKSPMGKQPPTHGQNTHEPVGKQPPIIINEELKNKEVCVEQPKTPSEQPTDSGKLDSIPLAQGTATPSPTPSPATGGKVKAAAPKVSWDGTRLDVSEIFLAELVEAYPHVNAPAAIKRASIWCLSNPRKRPKSDFPRFLNGWFGKVKPGDKDYIDPTEQAEIDATLIRDAESSFPDPDERADYFYVRKQRGLRVPPGVECRPMPDERKVV